MENKSLIYRNTIRKTKRRKNYKSKAQNHDLSWINNISQIERTLDEQISVLISEIEEKSTFYNSITDIRSDLKCILNSMFHKKKIFNIFVFGSAELRLALRGSDVDIFVDIQDNIPENFLYSLKKAILRQRLFMKPFVIEARIPVLRCVHQSGISCDVVYSNSFGVANTKLVNFLLELDERIKPTLLILKFLMKNQGLSVLSGIKGHCLILLFIFFLQQLEEPLMPTIMYLQNLTNANEMISDWNVSFSSNVNGLKYKNNMNIPELLINFFKFYSNFEFELYVISIFSGKAYLKSIFGDVNLVPDEFSCYKKNVNENKCKEIELKNFMCVQDIFLHNNNVSRNVTQSILINFQKFCLKNFNLCDAIKKTESFNLMFYEELLKKNLNNFFKNDSVMDNLLYVGKYIDWKNCKIYTIDDLISYWCKSVIEKLKYVLTKILKCKIIYEANDTFSDYLKNFITSETSFIVVCEFSNHGLVSPLRKKARADFEFPKEVSLLNAEEMISNYLCDTLLKDLNYNPIKILIICDLQKGPTCIHLKFNLDNNSSQNNFDKILTDFRKYVIKWLQASS